MKALVTVAYDGTNYFGWQRQKGQLTVQQVLEEALSKVYGQKISCLGASRTDAGVHATGQRSAFTLPDGRIPIDRLNLAINTHLPPDIRILSSTQVPDSFKVINDAKEKTYRYKIQNNTVYDPMMYKYAYHVKTPLNIEAMEKAAAYFCGKHDFRGFCAAHGSTATTTRIIYSLNVTKANDIITIEICGNGFLYNMVRIIGGTLADVGRGKTSPAEITNIIKSCDRKKAGATLPAKGLTLVNIVY